ncbi:MAG: hypothetical protein ABFS45_03965 [Pseudomonadota bacterium]
MTLNERRCQKKLQKKKKKRQLVKKTGSMGFGARSTAASYAKYPIYECLVPSGLFENGLGTIITTRQTPSGEIAVSAFVVDVFCLGVKNAFFKVANEETYQNTIKPRIMGPHQGQFFENTHPSCVRKIIEGAADYAGELGFSPHPDYRSAKAIFGDIESGACPVKYDFGQEGMPMYIRGPHESTSQARKIVEQLDRRCGEGNYHYLVSFDDGTP